MNTSIPPRLLAEMCLVRAWDDDTDDDSRELLEIASEALTRLCERLERQAAILEQLEARA